MTRKRFVGPAVLALAGVLLGTGGKTFAAPFMFGTFTEPSAAKGFVFTNGATSGTITASTAVDFQFTAPTGLGTAEHAATLTIVTAGVPSTIVPASVVGTQIDQPISVMTTLSITESGTGKNLLSMVFTGDIVGQTGSPNADLSGSDSTGQTVIFASDFLTFAAPGNSYNLGLATITSPLSIGAGGFLSSLVANVDGMFTANVVPEPGTLALLALGVAGLVSRRRGGA